MSWLKAGTDSGLVQRRYQQNLAIQRLHPPIATVTVAQNIWYILAKRVVHL